MCENQLERLIKLKEATEENLQMTYQFEQYLLEEIDKLSVEQKAIVKENPSNKDAIKAIESRLKFKKIELEHFVSHKINYENTLKKQLELIILSMQFFI
ncbi:hypothetical protein [Metabacillus fastidiosus]|uniref:hypothetical protein n=1 Tax=Metabacillus fastidiosus TaxID=1458 RepID=UPI002E1A8BA1|nr:hypothetical protein [Metabacillus fastidiosus]